MALENIGFRFLKEKPLKTQKSQFGDLLVFKIIIFVQFYTDRI